LNILDRFLMLSKRVKLILCGGTTALYLLFFLPAYQVVEDRAGILATLPVFMMASLFGLRAGLVASLVFIPVNTVLLNMAGKVGFNASIREGSIFGVVALIFTSVVIGYLRDIFLQLREEVKNRMLAEEEVRQLNQTLELRVSEQTEELLEANEALRDEIIETKRVRDDLKQAEDFATTVISSVNDGIIVYDRQMRYMVWNEFMERLTGLSADKVVGHHASDLFPFIKEQGIDRLIQSALEGVSSASEIVAYDVPQTEKTGWMSSAYSPLRDTNGEIIGAVAVIRDMTENRLTQEHIRDQLIRLDALRIIQFAASASLDLNVTFDVLLEQVTSKLDVDAATILLFDPVSHKLRFAAGRGFRTDALKYTQLQVGEGCAGRALLERRLIHIPDLTQEPQGFTRSPLFEEEDFISYCAVPLITKAQVRGILELFNRYPREYDEEWFTFFETLGYDAAIAVDNSTMFDELQRANTDLIRAYDNSLEGWARALDLRDKETEGHTQRVTEFTTCLAKKMGISIDMLVNIRRGALLHDIGKMAIPDSILLKPGPLTDEEWEIMRKHPKYAYDLIYPIEFLRPAIDIPYSHHEKWDGTGYPRGLKGEAIPLASRIFAVIDVWDALNSDRPYRKAWPREKILDHIKEQSGKHFDPKVVEVFLDLEPEFYSSVGKCETINHALLLADVAA
jgi:PAS domain S-box-containing protein